MNQERNAFTPHWLITIAIREAFVVIANRCGGLGRSYTEAAVS